MIVAVLLVFYQIKALNETTVVQLQEHNQTFFQENCARCHGTSGEGFASYPPLHGNNLSAEEIKQIIRFGRGDMPPFPNIQEPKLTQLAEYVSQI